LSFDAVLFTPQKRRDMENKFVSSFLCALKPQNPNNLKLFRRTYTVVFPALIAGLTRTLWKCQVSSVPAMDASSLARRATRSRPNWSTRRNVSRNSLKSICPSLLRQSDTT